MGKSTGPRTPHGKKRSSQNAAKHWIQAGRILPWEQEDAGLLRHGFMEDFNPTGLAEEELIDDMVLNRLIRRRADVAFTREFSKARAARLLNWLETYESTASQFWLRSSGRYPEAGARLRPDLCIAVLQNLRRRIEESGPEPDKDLLTLRRAYGGEPTEHAALLMYDLEQMVAGRKAGITEQPELQKSILEVVEAEIQLQKERLELQTRVEEIDFASVIQEPATPTLETLLRYRAANTREFKDLLDALERIRRLRQGPA